MTHPIAQIEAFFADPPPRYLNQAEAAAYLLYRLSQGEDYGTGLLCELEISFPQFRLSDTVLYAALHALMSYGIITDRYVKTSEGRGRPRRVFTLREQWKPKADEIGHLWIRWAGEPAA